MEAAGLTGRFDGSVLEPDARGMRTREAVFNAMIDRRPAVIAQCESADDVAAALAHARSEGLEVAIRSGGHSVAGASSVEGGLVIDMRRMNTVTVDPEARTATVEGGATWSDFDRACQPHGLAATGGRVSTTGVAGLTLGGGSGWLERKFGLACGQPRGGDLVTADGGTVTRQRGREPGAVLGAARRRRQLRRRHRARLPAPCAARDDIRPPALAGRGGTGAAPRLPGPDRAGAPDELGGGLAYLTGPPEEFVPDHLQRPAERATDRRLRRAGGRGRARLSRRSSSSSPRPR